MAKRALSNCTLAAERVRDLKSEDAFTLEIYKEAILPLRASKPTKTLHLSLSIPHKHHYGGGK